MLKSLSRRLAKAYSIEEKLAILDDVPLVRESPKKPLFEGLNPEYAMVLKQMLAIGQDSLFPQEMEPSQLHRLLEKLVPIDHFYREIGGIVGYQEKILDLMDKSPGKVKPARYHSPRFLDISEETNEVKEAIDWGIEAVAQMAEIYPLGGAADRLHLVDEETGQELPAAKLPFAGKTLLEHLIRDLEARENLYFQKYGKRTITPIAMMTSREKNNHDHVVSICEKANWFNRPKESIRFFTQPLVPTVDEKGNWCMRGPLDPFFKPGGHGTIWKLAKDEGIFDWFENLGRKKVLVRQINNPLAGLDYGLLAFTGYGCKKEMVFGFASCPRLLRAAEGVNVLIERDKEIVLTNVEYCDFAKFGIEDLPLKEGEPYSRFSSNTNILFADLKAVSNAVVDCPFPGLLINFKNGMARLESTMQNIADVFVEEKGDELNTKKTFVTYNRRNKTISTAKKAYVPGLPLQETPENCFYDLLFANRELLLECEFRLPPVRALEDYLQLGPECLFLYHPFLGPLYSEIRQKLKGGSLALGSEFLIEMAHFKASNLQIDGSLQIIGSPGSRCSLENVVVQNKGVDWNCSSSFWKMKLHREETVKIVLKGKSEFIAQNIRLKGNQTFVVEEGQTLKI